MQFFEVDGSEVLAGKQRIMEACRASKGARLGRPSYVCTDWAAPGQLGPQLARAGFNPQQKSLFLCEGLTYYISSTTLAGLFQEVSALSAPGTRLSFDLLHDRALIKGHAPPPGLASMASFVEGRGCVLQVGMAVVSSCLDMLSHTDGFWDELNL